MSSRSSESKFSSASVNATYFHASCPYPSYSMSRCLLECRVGRAFEELGCAPWSIPWATKRICNPRETSQFNVLTSQGFENCSHCKPDCEATEFDFRLSSAPIRKCDRRNMHETDLCSFDLSQMKPQSWADKAIKVGLHRLDPSVAQCSFRRTSVSKRQLIPTSSLRCAGRGPTPPSARRTRI